MKRFLRLLLPPILLAAAAYSAYVLYVSDLPAAPPLPAGVALVRPADLSAPASSLAGERGAIRVLEFGGRRLPFDRAVRVTTVSRPPHPYDVQLRLTTIAPVREGDALVARFYVRRPLLSPATRTDFVFERLGGDYRQSVVFPVEAGLRWRRVDIPFRSAGDYPAGGAEATLRAGFGPQTLEIGGLELVDRGKTAGEDPLTAVGAYEGREAQARWRLSAVERIERIRKSDLVVKVVGPDGRPAAGANVEVRLLKHSFAFGSALDSEILYGDGKESDKRKYKDTFLRLFNSATIENGLKWPFWKGERRVRADKTAAWLAAHGIRLRGHTLIWPGWENMPEGMRRLKAQPERLRAAIRAHIAQEASYYRGRVAQWDVLNEPLHQRDALDLLGMGEAREWFRTARAADPSATLYVNEYGIIDEFGADGEKQDGYEGLIRRLIDEGGSLDGIGIQCHFKWDLTPPERLLGVLDRFQRLGKPLEATELDIDVTDERLQADYLRDLLIALFSHPAVEGITLWGFWEGVHSAPAPAIYRRDWTKKPAALALEDLLLKRWHTEVAGVADGRGEFRARGFTGLYEIRASAGGAAATISAVLPKEGASPALRLARPKAATAR